MPVTRVGRQLWKTMIQLMVDGLSRTLDAYKWTGIHGTNLFCQYSNILNMSESWQAKPQQWLISIKKEELNLFHATTWPKRFGQFSRNTSFIYLYDTYQKNEIFLQEFLRGNFKIQQSGYSNQNGFNCYPITLVHQRLTSLPLESMKNLMSCIMDPRLIFYHPGYHVHLLK